jgi:hypothetical protein
MSKRSDNQTPLAWAGVLALGAVIMLSPTAHAGTLRRGSTAGSSATIGQGTFLSGYFDLGAGATADNILRLANPTAANGNLCAMIYIFNASEAMGECCGCLLTPNQLRQDSVKTILGAGWGFSGGTPSFGVMQIVSAVPNNGRLCAPQQAYTPTPQLNGWVTHAQTVAAVTGLTEVSLTDNGTADPTESSFLIARCGAIIGNGSGAGNCTCPKSEEVFTP